LLENNLKGYSDRITGKTGFDRISELLAQALATRKGQTPKKIIILPTSILFNHRGQKEHRVKNRSNG
jgi:hypothetical protein